MENLKVKKLVVFGKTCFKILFVLLTGIFMGFLALALVHLIPVDKMYQNVQASKDVINSFAEIVPGYKSTVVDDFTDSIILNEAICQSDAPLRDKIVNNYQVNYFKGYSQQENLLRYLEGEQGYRYQGYSHYWGGHQVIIKLLLLCFDYSDILILNYIVQTILIILIIVGLCKTGKEYAVFPFGVTVITMMPFATAMSLQLSDIFYISMLGSVWIIYREEQKNKMTADSKIKKWVSMDEIFIFLILGMLTSYLDFLTYPVVSLGIPLVFAVIYKENKGWWSQIKSLIINSVVWVIGYGGMWSGKWIFGAMLSPESNSIIRALESIKYRGSARAIGAEHLTLWDVFLKNIFVYLRRPTILLIGVLVIYLIVRIFVSKTGWKKQYILNCIPYMIICVYPLIWYYVTRNHSYEHAFMAYRELAIAAFAGLMMLAGLKEAKNSQLIESADI